MEEHLSDLKEKLARALEKRKAEAVVKKMHQKLMSVAHGLGDVIQDHYGAGSVEGIGSVSFMPHNFYYNSPEDDEMPILDDDYDPTTIGYCFDGIGRGLNLRIIFWKHEEILEAKHQNNLVYKEVSGIIECYVPNPSWEVPLESLYKMAAEKICVKDKEIKEENKDLAKKEKKKVLDYLKEFWGL